MSGISLNIRAFLVDPNPDANEDRELNIDSAELEDGTIWIYIKDKVDAKS